MGYPASSGTSLINVLHIAYLFGFPPVMGGGMITVNFDRLSFSAHSCTSDHGMSNLSSPFIGSSADADGDAVSSLLVVLLANAVFGNMLFCLVA